MSSRKVKPGYRGEDPQGFLHTLIQIGELIQLVVVNLVLKVKTIIVYVCGGTPRIQSDTHDRRTYAVAECLLYLVVGLLLSVGAAGEVVDDPAEGIRCGGVAGEEEEERLRLDLIHCQS